MEENKDILRALIVETLEIKEIPLCENTIHKILYKLKQTLPDNNSIKGQIPFYWFLYGPFSEDIRRMLYELTQDNIIEPLTTANEKEVFRFKREIAKPNNRDYADAKERLMEILKDVNPFNITPFIRDIYNTYAPSPFITMFRLDYQDSLKKFYKKIQLGKSDSGLLRRLENMIYDCESELIENPLFEQYNSYFSTFVTTADRIFDLCPDQENIIYLERLSQLGDYSVWNTFGKGIRIIVHDEDYNSREKDWIKKYNRVLTNYINDIESFDKWVLSSGVRNRLFSTKSTEGSKNILPSLLGDYAL